MAYKKLATTVTVSLFFLLSGIEYGVIIPTLLPYLEDFGAGHAFYGLSFSAYCLSGLVSAMIFGVVSDRLHTTKLLVLIAIACQAGGDLVFFTAVSSNMVLGGRLLAGVGMGGGSSIYTMLAWTSSERDRTVAFSAAVTIRNIGIVLGPALNLFLVLIDIRIGPYHISAHNSCGFFMFILWTVNFLMVPCMYFDPPVRSEAQNTTDSKIPQVPNLKGPTRDHLADPASSDALTTSDEEAKPLIGKRHNIQSNYGIHKSQSLDKKYPSGLRGFIKQYVREEIVVLFAIQFVQFFNQCAVETFIPSFGKEMFDWSVFDTSLLFAAASICTIVVYFVMRCLKGRVDRSTIIAGLLFDISGVSVLLGFLPRMKPNIDVSVNTAIFVLGCGLNIIGYPCVLMASAGLLSKLTAMSYQGRTQGLRRVITNIGMIMGPLWSGALMDHLYIMLSVMLGLLLFVWLLQVLSCKSMREPQYSRSLRNESASSI